MPTTVLSPDLPPVPLLERVELAQEEYRLCEVLVSPAMAMQWLEERAPNRPVRQRVVESYARDIARGHWRRQAEPIKFDRDGQLIDGQHRLWAVAEAGVAQEFTIALGLDPEVIGTLDTGVPRRFSDVLTIKGSGGHPGRIAAVLRLIWDYEHPSRFGAKPTHTDLAAIYSRFPEVERWDMENHSEQLKRLGQPTILLWASCMGARIDADAARRFISGVASGQGLGPGDPAYHLRERLIAYRGRRAGGPGKLTRSYAIGVTIKAWNYHITLRPLRHLHLLASEPYPRFEPSVPGLRNPPPERRTTDPEKVRQKIQRAR